MISLEMIAVLLFVAVWATIYVTAGSLLLRDMVFWIRRRKGKEPQPCLPRSRWFRRVVYTLAGAGILCMGYGYWIEPYWLHVSHTQVFCPKLPAGSSPLRVVHLSDLHCDPHVRLEKRLPAVVAALHPDVILFTGDAANSPAGLPTFRALMQELVVIAPVYAVRGNWDDFGGPHDPFMNTGVIEVGGKIIKTSIHGRAWCLTGVDVGDENQTAAVVQKVPPNMPTIFLAHYPSVVKEVAPLLQENGQAKADLMCSGHVHGGQVAMPFYGALVTLSPTGKQYEAGLYRVNQTSLYVSRGIGMEGGQAPRVRFLSRPEVAVLEICPAASPPP